MSRCDAMKKMNISSTKPREETLRIDFIFVILRVTLWMISQEPHVTLRQLKAGGFVCRRLTELALPEKADSRGSLRSRIHKRRADCGREK
jgi:hypothetical protein